tara:strand:- start:517 stop:1122 length:606 start_codon:yes stop_codon:yes gene_type:complete
MKFISIGQACNIKYQLDAYIGKKETLFFDRLDTDMNSVNTILSCKDITSILFFENIIQYTLEPEHNNNAQMTINSLSKCISKHDINKKITKKGINTFIAKYTRRFHRLLEYINGTEKIMFIRYNKITEEEKRQFIRIIKNINPACNFVLANIIIEQNEISIIRNTNFIEINLIATFIDDWTTSYLDWDNIFHILKDINSNH